MLEAVAQAQVMTTDRKTVRESLAHWGQDRLEELRAWLLAGELPALYDASREMVLGECNRALARLTESEQES